MTPEAVRMVVCDIDGVLTDGRVGIGADGREFKVFSVLDGAGIKLLLGAGIEVGFLSGRSSEASLHRARELGVTRVVVGVDEKRPALVEMLRAAGREPRELCYVGDDLVDIPCMLLAGWPVAVANAHPEVVRAARYVTRARGGDGAVREVAEAILKARGAWDAILERYLR
jgi:3-deoxy-D-manno-octulosonate 8-phosphate phosphatase (KDO 8-P phosphatase)